MSLLKILPLRRARIRGERGGGGWVNRQYSFYASTFQTLAIPFRDQFRQMSHGLSILFVFKATEVTQQKKAYRILEQICGADSESCQKFVVSHLKELQEILLKTLASSGSASKTVSKLTFNIDQDSPYTLDSCCAKKKKKKKRKERIRYLTG